MAINHQPCVKSSYDLVFVIYEFCHSEYIYLNKFWQNSFVYKGGCDGSILQRFSDVIFKEEDVSLKLIIECAKYFRVESVVKRYKFLI